MVFKEENETINCTHAYIQRLVGQCSTYAKQGACPGMYSNESLNTSTDWVKKRCVHYTGILKSR